MLDSRAMRLSRFAHAPCVLVLLLGLVLPARADTPPAKPPRAGAAATKAPPEVDPRAIERVVGENLTSLREVRDGLAPTVKSVGTAWVAIEAILRARGRYMSELQAVVALTRPGGVAALDRLDNAASDALAYLITLFLEKDRAEPAPAAARAFQKASAGVPATPAVPIGFIILTRTDGLAVAALNCIRANPALPPEEVKRAAIRALALDLANYLDAVTNEKRVQLTMEATADYTANRLRCPSDGAAYEIVGRRTGVKPDESLFRRLVCRCKECRREVKIDFDYPKGAAASRAAAPGGVPPDSSTSR
jgi:hypothetical protein